MRFCDDMVNNIPLYMILKAKNMKHVKSGKQKLSNVKLLVSQLIRVATMANRHDLLMRSLVTGEVLAIYRGVKHFFAFPTLLHGKVKVRCCDNIMEGLLQYIK